MSSFNDKELFEIELTNMSTAFMAAFLSRPFADNLIEGRFHTLDEQRSKELARKSVELAHYLIIEIQECVELFEKEDK